MKKKILVFVFILAAMFALSVMAYAADITVSFINTNDPTSTSTTLDKNTVEGGKLVVGAGESFTLPYTSSASNTGEEGYQLLFYAEDGRTYKAGETVSFDKDTRLFRGNAKEVYDVSELSSAINGDSKTAILMADIDMTSALGTTGRSQCVLVLNGHTVNFSANANFMGAQRAGKHIIGEGTVNITNPNGKLGSYAVFNCQSHGYDGVQNKSTIGMDVTINAPSFYIFADGDGSYNDGYPWVRVFGNVNVYSLGTIGNAGNRSPRIEVFENAKVTITGPSIFRDYVSNQYNRQKLQLTIYGGTFTLPAEAQYTGFWSNDFYDENVHTSTAFNQVTLANGDKILVYGGTFNVKLPDVVLGATGYAIEYDEASGVSTVVAKSCANGAHSYAIAEAYLGNERDCITDGIHYFRCPCGAYSVQPIEAMGHSYTIVEVEKEASYSENGIKRVRCDRCDDNYTYEYSLSPLEAEITIKVNTENGVESVTMLAGDLFEMTTEETVNGFFCTISAVKDNADFAKADIVEIQLPPGVLSFNSGILDGMTSLKEIVLLDRSNTTFRTGSLSNCPALEKITIGKCTVTFESKVATNSPNFATLDLRQGSAIFMASAFDLNPDIKQILMAAGNTYDFGEKSFHECGLTSLELVDDSIVKLGTSSFAECQYLEYVYIGRNCIEGKTIPDSNGSFDGVSRLKKVVIMDLIYLGKWAFSGKAPGAKYGPLSDMTIYAHSESLNISADAFNNKKGDYHVYLYTTNPSLTKTSYSNCNITVYVGIGHGYVADVIEESTCVTQGTAGYITDCPCGIDYRTVAYTTYSNVNADINGVENQPFGTEIVSLPLSTEHKVSDIVIDVTFEDGMTAAGKRVYKCMHCDVAAKTEDEASFPAVFVDYGYSVSTYGTESVVHSYSINRVAYGEYVEITGNSVIYGVVVAVKANVENGVLVDGNGIAVNEKIMTYSCTSSMYDVFDVRITGLKNHGSTELYVCGYYVVDGEAYYVGGTNGGKTPVSVTYDSIA